MDKRVDKKRGWLVCGAVALVAFLAGVFLYANFGQVSAASIADEQSAVLPISTLSTKNMTENKSDVADGSADVRLNDVRARWNGDKWEYSSDNGETWTDEAPEGFKTGGDGSFSIWQGEGTLEDFDANAWEQELDGWFASIYEEVDNIISSAMPEGHEEWDSFVQFGDTIAKQTENSQWEYSSDGGETWTDEAPEGFSVSEDGTRFSIGGGEDFADEFDYESFWQNLWPEYFEETRATNTVSV